MRCCIPKKKYKAINLCKRGIWLFDNKMALTMMPS